MPSPRALAPNVFALCADDYAMTPAVSRGILEALDAGVLTATSVMTTSPHWPGGAAALKRHQGSADIGLHLNLTLAAPLGPMPDLAPGGRLPDIRALIRLQRRGRLPLAEITEEIGRQCDAFADVFGCPPSHVDGHQHAHVLPPIRRVLFEVLARRGWRPWVRDSGDLPRRLARRAGAAKALALCLLARGFAREASGASLVCNDGFAGFSRFDPASDYGVAFKSYLRMPGPLHLVMCHPGYADDELRNLDPVVATREQELRFFLSPGFRKVLGETNMSLRRLSAIEA